MNNKLIIFQTIIYYLLKNYINMTMVIINIIPINISNIIIIPSNNILTNQSTFTP
jgi:hypothetical protein